jgi:thiamine kinase-like enzyme
LNSKTTYTSFFEVLNFDIEKQFVNPDLNKLDQLASQTQGTVYYPNQVAVLIKSLLQEENYKPMQKEIIKKTPFVDWIWVLVLIIVSLALEWFIRKYHGML